MNFFTLSLFYFACYAGGLFFYLLPKLPERYQTWVLLNVDRLALSRRNFRVLARCDTYKEGGQIMDEQITIGSRVKVTGVELIFTQNFRKCGTVVNIEEFMKRVCIHVKFDDGSEDIGVPEDFRIIGPIEMLMPELEVIE